LNNIDKSFIITDTAVYTDYARTNRKSSALGSYYNRFIWRNSWSDNTLFKFFIKPKLNLQLNFIKKNHTDLEARIINNGRILADEAHIAIKISGVINYFEAHPWRKIYATSIHELEQIPETSILPDEYALSYITTIIPESKYSVTKTLHNQEGYTLELDKRYSVQIKVTGLFKMVKWSFTMTPKSTGEFEYSPPAEIY
jgi:hypothetical protein